MLLQQKTETFVAGEDHSWLGSAHANDTWDSITLDGDAFLTAFPTGVVPSGVVLGKVTSSGLYVPYGASPSEVQTITFDATGGTYNLAFDGATTPTLTYANAAGDATTILNALNALPTINPGDVTVVRGTPSGNVTVFTITFGGRYLGQNVPQIDATNVVLTGGSATVTEATTTVGGGTVSDGSEVARGHLATTKDLGGTTAGTVGNTPAALMRHGQVIEAKLPSGHGLDAAAKADLSQILYV